MNCQQVFLNVKVFSQVNVVNRRNIQLFHSHPLLRAFSNHVIYPRTKFPTYRTFKPFSNQNFHHRRYFACSSSVASLSSKPINIEYQKLSSSKLFSNRTFKTTSIYRIPTELVQFNLSDIGEGIGEVTIKEWFVEVGSSVKQFDQICEVQSDKASVTITSRFDGKVKKLYYDIDQTAKVGLPLVDIEIESSLKDGNQIVDEVEDQITSKQNLNTAPVGVTSTNLDSYKKTLATPAVRRLAQEYNVKLINIQGTGKDGRVLKEDIVNYIETNSKSASSGLATKTELPHTTPYQSTAKSSKDQDGEENVIPITGIRKAMFKAMTLSNSIPQFQLSDEIDMTNIVSMSPFLKRISAREAVPIKPLSFLIKSSSTALKSYPILNSTLNDDKIISKRHHNIGFAMDTPGGLVVPNIKSVQDLTILEISREIKRLHEAGMRGQLSPNDLTNGTFTISNIGSIGGTFGIPLILPPEIVIGAVGRIRLEPKFDEKGSVVPKHIMTVVWSADHRIIDGATITRFNNLWKSYLELPESLLIELK